MPLTISKLSKRFANNSVLRDVEFDLEPGQVLAVLGSKGSGKSTLIDILGGKEKPSPINLDFGLNNNYADIVRIDPGGSVFRTLFRRTAPAPDAENRIRNALDQSQTIVAFDDPLVSYDRGKRSDLLLHIRSAVKDKRHTAIYATADFETAAAVSDKIAVLSSGTITQVGGAEEIYSFPVNSQVARLTGRCNLIEARRLTSTKFDIPEFQTLDGDHRLFAERTEIAKLGAINRNVWLAVRPEDISMSFGASFPEDNLLKSVVTGKHFRGPVTIVELNADGLILEAAVTRLVGLDIGQECIVALPPDRVRILKD